MLGLKNRNVKYLKLAIAIIVIDILILTLLPIHTNTARGINNKDIMKKTAPKVLFDFTKDEDAGNADWTIDGAYSNFADALRNAGFTVDSLGTGTGELTLNELQGYNVLVIPEPQDNFSATEKNAIINFVHSGGGLVYIADHNRSDRNNNGWDSWHIWNENLEFGSIFNITLTSTEAGVGSNNVVNNINSVPVLTDNVNSFGIWSGTTMQVSGNAKIAAEQSINGTAYPVLAYSYYGTGRVVVHGDSSTFDDGSADSSNSGDKLYDGWSEYDDSTLGVNLVRWASNTNTTGDNSTYLKSHEGTAPSTSYGNGNYIVAYENGNYIYGYFVNSSTGTQGKEMEIYKYGAGVKTAYNPDGKNFTALSYDYATSSGVLKYHKILLRFVKPTSANATSAITLSNDANKSVDVVYGNHELLIVWANLTRNEVKGVFYNTQTATFGNAFTIATGTTEKYSVAVGYDAQSSKFLVVWTENYDINGAFVGTDGALTTVSFSHTASVEESQLSVAGGNGKFMVTYRNGTFSSAKGAYFIMVSDDGTVSEAHNINNYDASYCGRVIVKFSADKFMLSYSDQRNGNADVFLRFYNTEGAASGNEMNITASSNNEEMPACATDGSTMIVVWDNYISGSNQNIEGKYYPPNSVPVPEFTLIAPMIIVLMLLLWRRTHQ